MTALWKRLYGPAPKATVDPEGAHEATQKAQLVLEEEIDRTTQAVALGNSLRDLQERNHFAELFLVSMARRESA